MASKKGGLAGGPLALAKKHPMLAIGAVAGAGYLWYRNSQQSKGGGGTTGKGVGAGYGVGPRGPRGARGPRGFRGAK